MLHRFWRFRLLKERHELAFIRSLKLTGATALDIGANKGIFSYWLSSAVGANGQVIAFEPQPELTAHLAKVKKQFQCNNLEVIASALSNQSGSAQLQRNHAGAGHATLQHGDDYQELISVPTTTLDEFAYKNKLSNVRFMKIDVEGHELDVLHGANEVIRKHQPHMLIETHKHIAAGVLLEFLDQAGYKEPWCIGKSIFAKGRDRDR